MSNHRIFLFPESVNPLFWIKSETQDQVENSVDEAKLKLRVKKRRVATATGFFSLCLVTSGGNGPAKPVPSAPQEKQNNRYRRIHKLAGMGKAEGGMV